MIQKITPKLLKSKKNTKGRGEELAAQEFKKDTPDEMQQMLEEFGRVKQDPMQITGEDFDRAFAFIDKYPESTQAESLFEEMNNISSSSLKGLSFESAVNVLVKMPDHPGGPPIIRGMMAIEREYIHKLNSDILIFMLEIIPEHPHVDTLAEEAVEKNFTNAYNFITRNREHPVTKLMIREMFKKDPNIAILLLQEQMDHPQMESIIEGVYAITPKEIAHLTPNAVIFVLDIAPDHKYAEQFIDQLVKENYIKAFEFIKEHMEYPNAEMMVNAICKRQPELKKLF